MINGNITQRGGVSGGLSVGVGATTDYTELENKPSINGVELIGNKTSSQLGLVNTNEFVNLSNTVNNLSGVVSNIKGLKDYSTEEQNTGIKWIDGKPIYKKTVRFENVIPKRSWNSYSFGVDNIETFVNVEFNRIKTDNNVEWSLNYNNSGSYFNSYWLTSGLVLYWYYSSSNNVDVIVTISYTKTTDAIENEV